MNQYKLSAVEADIAELKDILDNHSKRESIRRILSNELNRLEDLRKNFSTSAASNETKPRSSNLQTITNYAWDQSENFVKIYLSLDELGSPANSVNESTVSLTFPDSSSVQVICGSKKFLLTRLSDKINTQESYFKVLKSRLVLHLKKNKDGRWSNIQASQPTKPMPDEKEDVMEDNADPGSALMKLMKKMYNESDDDMKRTIAKSWYEAQQKNTSEIDYNQ